MIEIKKGKPPAFWSNFVKRYPKLTYKRLYFGKGGTDLPKAIRQHMLVEQGYLCAYCCKRMDFRHSHNEHIRPQAFYKQESMNYRNLVCSCITQGAKATCGMRKNNLYDEKRFISPTMHNCERHFSFREDGRIIGTTKEGKYTVELLNLNAFALLTARKQLFLELQKAGEIGKDFLIDTYTKKDKDKLPPFLDMTRFFLQKGYFDEMD